jgi:acetyltransferase-like isoleucine patch superfamily enzyme
MSLDSNSKTHAAVTGSGSALKRYMTVIVGKQSILLLIYFEFCLWLSPLPGVLGLALRKLFWPRLFSSCGKGTVFGTGIKLMHPGRIQIGKRCVISDGCILDGRNPTADVALVLGDEVMLAHGVMLSCKEGSISLGDNIGIGAYSVMQSTRGNPIRIESDCIIGPRCYITGGGNYNTERLDIPITQQGLKIMGGSTINYGVWLGAGVTVLGGIEIGRDSIVSASAVVSKSLPARSISVGVPAKVVKMREPGSADSTT